jgi:hypothetical protein
MMSNRIIYRDAESIDLGSGHPRLATRDGRPRAEPDKLLAGLMSRDPTPYLLIAAFPG